MPQNNEPRKLNRVVIKEELVALTGHFAKALILNQMIYWSERMKDFDLFLSESKRHQENLEVDLQHGWIYKNATELAKELMLDVSHQTMRRYLQALVEDGYIAERHNPKKAWDRTMQYRVDLVAVSRALARLGYSLEGYSMLDDTIVQDGQCNVQNGSSGVQNGDSSVHFGQAIPETITDTTTETTAESDAAARRDDTPSSKEKEDEKPTRPPRPSDHPLIQAYRDLHNRNPSTAQMKIIIEQDPPMSNWVRAIRAWAAKGHKPTNFEGMLEWAFNPTRIDERPSSQKSGSSYNNKLTMRSNGRTEERHNESDRDDDGFRPGEKDAILEKRRARERAAAEANATQPASTV